MKNVLTIHSILIVPFLISSGTLAYAASPIGAGSIDRLSPQQVRTSRQSPEARATKEINLLQKKSQESKQAVQRVRPTLNTQERQQFDTISRLVRIAVVDARARKQLDVKWAELVQSHARKNADLDINAMVQAVMFETWQHEEQELRNALTDLHRVNELKKQTRNELSRAQAHRQKMKTLPVEKKDYQPVNVKGVGTTTSIKTVSGMNSLIKGLENELNSIGDDAQLANIDMQNTLQRQQQTMQMMSQISKMLHDTAMAVIRKIGKYSRSDYAQNR